MFDELKQVMKFPQEDDRFFLVRDGFFTGNPLGVYMNALDIFQSIGFKYVGNPLMVSSLGDNNQRCHKFLLPEDEYIEGGIRKKLWTVEKPNKRIQHFYRKNTRKFTVDYISDYRYVEINLYLESPYIIRNRFNKYSDYKIAKHKEIVQNAVIYFLNE
jgi:hypothetical protein